VRKGPALRSTILAALIVVLAGVLGAIAVLALDPGPSVAPTTTTIGPLPSSSTSITLAPTSTMATITTTTTPIPTTTTRPQPDTLRRGDEGPEVAALQRRLAELGYRPGDEDGRFGAQTASALLAFQKHEGLTRDQLAGPAVKTALEAPSGAGPIPGLPIPRIEVDLDRQIAFVVLGEGDVTILNASTGSGEIYPTPFGDAALAYTPTGSFVIERRIDGVRHAPLGELYRPLYFFQGWAVHGSSHVPAFPASHGCVRVSFADMDWLFPRVADGTAVIIYDAQHPPAAPDVAIAREAPMTEVPPGAAPGP
jgi:lipoprotein-anchoring transpeptidase ErfK/SrfK